MRLEAVLLLAKTPLSLRKLCQMAHLADATEARTLIRQLNTVFEEYGRAIRVEQVAGGYRLMTRSALSPWLARLGHLPAPVRLSTPMMETLAVVAYRQPVSRADVEAVRGVGCGELLRQTMERDLVRIVGRSEELGRPYLYGTTKRFLQLFGLSNTDALPAIQWQALQDDPKPEDPTHDDLSTTKKELVVSTTVVPTFSESDHVVIAPKATTVDPSDSSTATDAAEAVTEDEENGYYDDDDDSADDDGSADDDDWDDQDWDDDSDSDDDESADDDLEEDDSDDDESADDDLEEDDSDDDDSDDDESADDESADDDSDDDDGGWEEVDDEVGDEEFDDDDDDEEWEEQEDDDEDWNE
ncbi:SMC-Scp complex subunit ScpB [bacterium]|nr:SMC-Scp complex subunit ScpB [bacterium]